MSDTLRPGDRAVYGFDPRERGFPLVERDIGTVRKVYATMHGPYAEVDFGPGRKPMRFPVDAFTKIEPEVPHA